MALRSILAAFSGDPASCSGLRFALDLQRRHAAHVTGVVWHAPGPVPTRHRAYLSRDVSSMLAEREDSAAIAVRRDFEARVAEAGDPAQASFIDLHAEEDFSLPERARAYDLVVMSRLAAEVGREHGRVRPDVVALRSGRPVITVPHDAAPDALSRPVVIAWDGKRAAARALADAVHLVGLTGPTVVLSIGDHHQAAPEAGDDVLGLLARHGVAAERLIRPAGRKGIARTLLDACSETGAGLLVMGAYEHSKLSEDLMGGVTRDILADAHLPVLMSH